MIAFDSDRSGEFEIWTMAPTDVFHHDIASLATAGITKRCSPPDNTGFCPKGDVTRQQMAACLVRALDLPAVP